jgi:hypothetical protein
MEEEFFPDAFSEATCTLQDEFPTCDWCQVRIDRRQQLTNKIAEKHAMQGVDAISEAEVLEAVATAAYKVAGWLEALAAAL